MALIPYVNFGGNCRDAFTYYHTVFGGELEVMGFDQLPEGADAPPNADNMVMHARLAWSEHDVLLGSDNPFDFDGVRGRSSTTPPTLPTKRGACSTRWPTAAR